MPPPPAGRNPVGEREKRELQISREHFGRPFENFEAAPNGRPLFLHTDRMVEMYNQRFPDMKVHHVHSMDAMFSLASRQKAQLDRGPIHCISSSGAHQTAWQIRSHGGRVTAIGIDSTELPGKVSNVSNEFGIAKSSNPGLITAGILVGTGVQKDGNSCGTFAMGSLNTFRKHSDHFHALSEEILRMEEGKGGERLAQAGSGTHDFRTYTRQESYRLLPAHAFKNAQSETLRSEFKAASPEMASMPVSKGGETLDERLDRQNREVRQGIDPKDMDSKDVGSLAKHRGADKKRVHLLEQTIRHVESLERGQAEPGARIGPP